MIHFFLQERGRTQGAGAAPESRHMFCEVLTCYNTRNCLADSVHNNAGWESRGGRLSDRRTAQHESKPGLGKESREETPRRLHPP